MKFLICILTFQVVYGTLCPDRIHRCPSWGSCCLNRDLKTYGCCPFKNADCCADFIHCCPPGTHCNSTNGSCDSNKDISTSLLWMVPRYSPDVLSVALEDPDIDVPTIEHKYDMNDTLIADIEDITCPDNNTCPDGSTCCETLLNTWSCCPFTNASCCKDKIHCCPYGYECDLKNMRCSKKMELHANLEKILVGEEIENNRKSSRTDLCGPFNSCSLLGQTCCKHENVEYCCPQGSICGRGESRCLKDKPCDKNSSLPDGQERIMNELRLMEIIFTGIVVCPDKTEACPKEQTCCKKISGEYGCCNLPVATCCPDGLSCCPNGYVCAKVGCERLPSLRLFHLPIFADKTILI